MRDLFTLFLHAIVTITRLGQRGGLPDLDAPAHKGPNYKSHH